MKKMRRLIPAFAMLMVAAIMLSTASFAWFTMGTDVTATGMQIKAKADSSLVIGRAPLTYNTGAPDADFESDVNTIVPMTFGTYQVQDKDENGTDLFDEDGDPIMKDVPGWLAPTNTRDINTATGAVVEGDTLQHIVAAEGTNFIEEELYIASAGAAMTNKKITITLSAPVAPSGKAHLAYAAAIYVVGEKVETTETVVGNEALWAAGGSVNLAIDAQPTAIIWVDDKATTDDTDGRNVVTLPETYAIPSILGVGEQNDLTTGFKIIIRFFVDGDLESVGTDQTKVTVGYDYTDAAGTAYDASTLYFVAATYKYTPVENASEVDAATYYVKDGNDYVKYVAVEGEEFNADGEYYTQSIDTYKPAVATPDLVDGTSTVVPAGWFTRTAKDEWRNYKYIRTDDVPSAGSQLELLFVTSDAQ